MKNKKEYIKEVYVHLSWQTLLLKGPPTLIDTQILHTRHLHPNASQDKGPGQDARTFQNLHITLRFLRHLKMSFDGRSVRYVEFNIL
jgi:hypothetical protein